MILDILNKRYALRNMSDEQFEEVLPQLAEELAELPYAIEHSETVLRKEWASLHKWEPQGKESASTTRVGMKLCEHFFPNFYNIRNSKEESFVTGWNSDLLQKVLRWNRKSHSTPYMSELRRGVYFCGGLTKNTMYRPHMAKTIVRHYRPLVVLDPCAGWGGRLLGTVAAGSRYIGYEPNIETYNNLKELVKFLDIEDRVELYNLPAEQIGSHTYDMVLTSPPYFNLEIYGDGKYQSENYYSTYEDWRDKWLREIIQNTSSNVSVSCWNVHNIGKMKLIDDVIGIHQEMGYSEDVSFSLNSSSRQTNQNEKRNKKSKDLTICFRPVTLSSK